MSIKILLAFFVVFAVTMAQPALAAGSPEKYSYGFGILEFERTDEPCNIIAQNTTAIVNSDNPLNPSPGTIFVKLAGPHSDEYSYVQLTVSNNGSEDPINNPAIIKEYFKDGQKFDGSLVTDYNPMAYVFDSAERAKIEADPVNQEFFNKTGVGKSWWAADNTSNGQYRFHAIVAQEGANGWIGNDDCAIGFDVEFTASNGNMVIDAAEVYFGEIQDISDTIAPLQQHKIGVNPQSISCGAGLDLVVKSSSGQPACVKPETKQILIERGWARSA